MLQSNKLVNNSNIYLLVIIVIATLLRILFLSAVPNGFYCDEASDGYEAYSILNTLRDTHGVFLPLFLKRFGIDYSEALFEYTMIPFIKVFGLNEFATRLPAAITGVLTVLTLYYLAKECFDERVGLVSALFLAINPWHIHFNRIAFRVNLLPLFFCLGLLFFVKSFRKPRYLPLSAAMFGVSLYTYSSARVFVPLFVLSIALVFWRHLWRFRKQTLIAITIFLPIFILLFSIWITPEGMARAKTADSIKEPLRAAYSYLTYFSPKLLFFTGHPDYRFSNRAMGALHYFELITVPAGAFFLFRENRKERIILFLWLLLYPVPAFLTAQYHATRSLVGTPLFAILSAYGICKLLELFRVRRKIYFSTIAFLAVISITIFCKNYFLDYPKYSAYDFQYGMREAIAYAEKSSHNCVVVSHSIGKTCNNTHIHTAFYTQYPPAQYQFNQINRADPNGDRVIGKYRVVKFNNDSMQVMQRSLVGQDKCLFIIDAKDIGEISGKEFAWKEVHVIKDLRGIELIKLLEVTGENQLQ